MDLISLDGFRFKTFVKFHTVNYNYICMHTIVFNDGKKEA